MPKETKDFYDFGPFRADTVRRLLLRDGQPVPVTSKVFDTLEVLLRNRDRVLAKEELLKEIWPGSFVEESNLTQNVSTLRKALCELPGEHRYIATVPGKGYRFVGEVRVPEPEIPPPPAKTEAAPARPNQRLAIASLLVAIAAGLAVSVWVWRTRQTVEAAPPRSLAILPFRQLTPQPGEEYMGVGLADAIITRMSNLRELAVRPTGSVLRYAAAADPLAAGRELNVEELLSGSIQQSGDHVRITVQLLRVKDGRPLWAETFDESTNGLFDIEDAVSSRVADKMTLRLGVGEKEQLRRRYTENAEAWRFCLQGRYAAFRFTRDGLEKAIEYFNRALALDPSYAAAWAGLADAYTTASDWVLAPRDALPKADAAARKALSFDDRLAEAHSSLAHALMHEWKLADSGKEFHRALSLTPNNTSFYFAYSEYLTALHKYDGAVTELKKALKLDPLSTGILSMMSWPLYLKGDFDGCLKADKDTLQVDPNFWIPYMYDAFVFLRTKRYAEAIPQFEKARSLNPDSTLNLSGLGATYALSGRRNDALAMVAKLDEWSRQRYVSPMDLAYIYGALGDRDKAMQYLYRGYEDQSEMMLFLPLYSEFGLGQDPRFQELQRKVPVG